jgi:hypothetical protein
MRLRVCVRLDGVLIDDAVIRASHGVRVGEHDDALVSFPGADLVVHRESEAIRVRGHRIRDGETLTMHLGAVRVDLTAFTADRPAFRPRFPVDAAMPIMLAAIILLTLASQNLSEALSQKADVSVGVARAVEALLLPPDLRRIERVGRPTLILGDPPPPTRVVRFVEQLGPAELDPPGSEPLTTDESEPL